MLTIAGIVCAVLAFNGIYPAIGRSNSAIVSRGAALDDRIKSQIDIVHAIGELDADEVWQDTDEDGKFDIYVWVKNVGNSCIYSIEESDIFFGETGDFTRIPYAGDAGESLPQWSYQIENNTEWETSATLKITIDYSTTALSSGNYWLKTIISNGIADEYNFSM